jgi:hypothetical protein
MCEDWYLPSRINFNIPGRDDEEVELIFDEDVLLYRQLVCWCLIQRYWYYVIGCPKVKDYIYDKVEEMVKEMEKADYLNNPYSPTRKPGSSNQKDYPVWIVHLFWNIQNKRST